MFCKIITFINEILLPQGMDYAELSLKNSAIYRLGISFGFFTGFLILMSMLYFVLGRFHKIPSFIRYPHVAAFVIIAFALGLIILKLRK